MPSKLHTTATQFLAAFETLDADTFTSLQASNYTHVFAPASAGLPGQLDGPQFAHHIEHLRDILRGFPVKAKEVFDNETRNQVTVWATNETWFRDEVKDDGATEEEWLFHGEYIFVLNMDSSGEKIERVLEFLDSKGTDVLRGIMGRAMKNHAKSTGGAKTVQE